MVFYTLASGSSGNAALVLSGGTAVLLDAGISARRIEAALRTLGLSPAELSAVLITHEHSDHISGVKTLVKRFSLPIYASYGTASFLSCGGACLRSFAAGDRLSIGPLQITSFRTSHDAADSVGYRLDDGSGSLGILTDTGVIPREASEVLCGVDTLLLEANHDVDLLLGGPYPYRLKQRILGPLGHLSNETAADFALRCAQGGTGEILLAHLSAENNTPAHALSAVEQRLEAAGFALRLSVAPRDTLSEAHEVHTLCKV